MIIKPIWWERRSIQRQVGKMDGRIVGVEYWPPSSFCRDREGCDLRLDLIHPIASSRAMFSSSDLTWN